MSNQKESSVSENRLPYSNDKKKYYDEVNIVRGIALLLVVLGHSFPDGDFGIKSIFANWIHTWVYTFHMGIFFVLSGFVMSNRLCSGTYKICDELKKKALRLLLPYFIYSFLTLGPKLVLTGFVNHPVEASEIGLVFLGKSPNGGMWFLWQLFVISMIYLLAFRLMKNLSKKLKLIIVFLSGILFYIVYISFSDNILENTFFKFSVFFVIGIVANQYYDRIVRLLKMPVAIFAIAVTITLACPFFNINRNMIYILTGIIGLYGFYTIGYKLSISKSLKVKKLFKMLGTYSYDIYLLSYFVQIPARILFYSILHLPYWLCVSIMFISGISIPWLLSKILRKNRILSGIFLGNFNSRPNRIR